MEASLWVRKEISCPEIVWTGGTAGSRSFLVHDPECIAPPCITLILAIIIGKTQYMYFTDNNQSMVYTVCKKIWIFEYIYTIFERGHTKSHFLPLGKENEGVRFTFLLW